MSDDNFQTVPLQTSLNATAINRAAQAIQATGRALPCRVIAVMGSIVTVKFETTGNQTLPPITIPKAESQWMRAPTQIGDFGTTQPSDTWLGGVSGLGSGVANIPTNYGNLTTLVWVPCAAVAFPDIPTNVGPNRAWINGPMGAAVSDAAFTVYTLHDGVGGTSSVVAPALVGLGALASSLSTTNNAAVRFTDLNSALVNQVTQMIGNSHIQLLTAIVANGGLPSGASATTLLGTLASSGFPIPGSWFTLLSSLHGITTPPCSAKVLIQ